MSCNEQVLGSKTVTWCNKQMSSIDAKIVEIGVSGRHWIGSFGKPNFDLVIDTLEKANNNIRIATFSLGYKSKELDRLFSVLKRKSETGIQVQVIVNRLFDEDRHSDYARDTLGILAKGRNFTAMNFEPDSEKENLHAKLFSIDGEYVLIGSANMSKSGMFGNHEIMIKVEGKEFASKINDLLDKIAESIYEGGTL